MFRPILRRFDLKTGILEAFPYSSCFRRLNGVSIGRVMCFPVSSIYVLVRTLVICVVRYELLLCNRKQNAVMRELEKICCVIYPAQLQKGLCIRDHPSFAHFPSHRDWWRLLSSERSKKEMTCKSSSTLMNASVPGHCMV